MIYTNPGFIYILLALLLCCIYYGVEMSNEGLQGTGKSILSSWCVTSLIILAIILAIKKAQDNGKTTSKHIMIMYGLSIGTIVSSCLIIMSAS